MFLLHRDIFAWDLAILLMLTFSLCILFVSWTRIHGTRASAGSKFFAVLTGLCAFVGFCTVTYGSFIEPRMLTKTTYDIAFPVARPLRIVVLSDLHIGPYKGSAYLRKAVRTANNALPDIIILTGDYFFTPYGDTEDLAPLDDLRASLGVFAVLGNHDVGQSRTLAALGHPQGSRRLELLETFDRMGITVLENDSQILRTSMGDIAVAGVGDAWARMMDVGKALTDLPSDIPLILAAHSPDVILDPRARRAQIIVAGHTHGGQIRLPFIGPVPPIPTRVGQAYDQGLFPLDQDTTLAITRGIGESSARARLFAPPEIMIIEAGLGSPK